MEKNGEQILVEARKLVKNCYNTLEKCQSLLQSSETMAKLLPAIIWKTENLPNEFIDLAKQNPRENVEGARFVLLFCFFNCIRYKKRDELKRELCSFPAQFIGNMKEA